MNGFDLRWIGDTAPLTVVGVGGLLVLLLESFSRGRGTLLAGQGAARSSRGYLATVAVLVLGVAALLEAQLWLQTPEPRLVYGNMLAIDRWSIAVGGVLLVGGALSVLLAGGFMREHGFEFGEHYALVLFATAGMLVLVQATDLVTLFVGIETMSLAVYVLVGSWRHATRSSEAAMKYFLVGAVASAVLLYGVALVYGTTGTTNLVEIGRIAPSRIPDADLPVFLVGSLFILAALAFKVAAVPFHMWLPDAYEGAPTPVTAFMAAGVKAAGFAALVRVAATAYAAPALTFGAAGWSSIAATLAMLTMTLGNLAALRQENVKRMLAWSSIAHAGYLLVGVAAMGAAGAEARGAILFYLLAYTFTTVGSFGLVAWYGSRGDERQHLDDWAGLGARHPAAALAMTLFLLSLGGFPPTAGFFGKLYVFRAALAQPGLGWLVVLAVLNSVVSVYYYLRVVAAMYFREGGREPSPVRSPGMAAALLLAALGTLGLGLAPGWLVELVSQAALFAAR